jgi:soluble lytic murein transglycosylase-like protein
MQMVYAEGFRAGVAKERKSHSLASFFRGLLLGVLLAIVGIGAAVAQQIPDRADYFRRDLTRLSRSVWGMDAPISNLAAQIHQESTWNPNAQSWAGAQGLAQFMPLTASDMAKRYGEAPQPFSPRWAMLNQSRYMKSLYDNVSGINECQKYAFALAAYNGGLGWVNRRKAISKNPNVCLYQTCEINPGITAANQRENAEYSKKILLKLTPLYYQAMWGPARCYP